MTVIMRELQRIFGLISISAALAASLFCLDYLSDRPAMRKNDGSAYTDLNMAKPRSSGMLCGG